ncbi:MAG: translation initiation factor IF-2 subunit gamma, partial [Thaumarchaeota archaeon]|nr:translation initiation factor IF-2 subunit gamma [Candidatus Calditenuaceae archaeon]
CPLCEEPFNYRTSVICPVHGVQTELARVVSFIDCPGHHSLMITMLSGAPLFDGALFVVDARVKFPQPQDREHLEAMLVMGMKKIVFAQNKVDVVTPERARENYSEIVNYTTSRGLEEPVVVPISAQQGVGVEALLYAMERYIPTPKRDPSKPFLMPILRSFDVNMPGTIATELKGGVIGGSIIQGSMRLGDEIEIVPGLPVKPDQQGSPIEPVYTVARSIRAGGKSVREASCGGLVGIETDLDPSFTKSDGMAGNTAGKPGYLPPVWTELELEYRLFEKVVGVDGDLKVGRITPKEALVINTYSAVTSGLVTSVSGERIGLKLTRAIAASIGDRVTISRKVGTGWRLIGYGRIMG